MTTPAYQQPYAQDASKERAPLTFDPPNHKTKIWNQTWEDVYAVCRLEIPIMNMIGTNAGFSKSEPQGLPARWTFGSTDFVPNWTKVLWISENEYKAKTKMLEVADQWRVSDDVFPHLVHDEEVRVYMDALRRDQNLREKVYVEGPFRVAEKWEKAQGRKP
jgi:hypothetical protein